ncbi:hypothetical protein [Lysinibacillus sp. 54212]|uniref:hypothetical protein n=1 Tax=Lysinibacillus sp. 54212 TaxID=3119829 RepID=UPI003FA5E097
MGLKGLDKAAKLGKLGKAASKGDGDIPYNVMATNKLKDLVKKNVYGYMQQKGKQLEDLWKSNFGKEAIARSIHAMKNSAVITKARNVLDPENIKAVAAKTYDDVIKGPIAKTKTWANERLNQILDTPIGNTVFATNGPTGSTTVRDVIEQAKDSFSQIKVDGTDNPRTRLPRSNGHWKGEPGNGKWYSDKPEVKKITNGEGVEFKEGRPNFTPWSEGDLVFEKGQLSGTSDDFSLVYEQSWFPLVFIILHLIMVEEQKGCGPMLQDNNILRRYSNGI